MNGFYNVYKPAGISSSHLVVKVRGILRSRTGERPKVGHFGTLDPAAEGVLPIAVGSATKLFDYSLDKIKVYRADFVWGQTTDTLDADGTLVAEGERVEDPIRVEAACRTVVGTYGQIPPQYSAKSVGGVRAYDLARRGVEVVLQPKQVTVHGIEMLGHEGNCFSFVITCSAGTYIRSICRDIATAMGTVGYMSRLIRLRSGDFDVTQSVSIEEIEADYRAHFLSLDRYADALPHYDLAEDVRRRVDNGVPMQADVDDALFCVRIGGVPYGIGTTKQGLLKIICRL